MFINIYMVGKRIPLRIDSGGFGANDRESQCSHRRRRRRFIVALSPLLSSPTSPVQPSAKKTYLSLFRARTSLLRQSGQRSFKTVEQPYTTFSVTGFCSFFFLFQRLSPTKTGAENILLPKTVFFFIIVAYNTTT